MLFGYCDGNPCLQTDPTGLVTGWGASDPSATVEADGTGYSYKWKYKINQAEYGPGQNYRIFQSVSVRSTWEYCDGAKATLQRSYAETFDPQEAKDEQKTGNIKSDGEKYRQDIVAAGNKLEGTRKSKCADKVKSYTESRVNVVFLAEMSKDAKKAVKDGDTAFVDLQKQIRGLGGGDANHVVGTGPTAAAKGFEYVGDKLENLAIQGSGLKGSGSGYGIMYSAEWECCSGKLVSAKLRVDWNDFASNNKTVTKP